MKFTFGITTCASENEHHLQWRDRILFILDSIRSQNIPEYEIIIVGGPYPKNGRNAHRLHAYGDVVHIPFSDEESWEKSKEFKDIKINKHPGLKNGWITKKKNLIWKNSKYNNIVMLHDYYYFLPGWYENFKKFGDDWDFCWNVKLNYWNGRHRDWVSWDHPSYPMRSNLPYTDTNSTKYQYFDGNYTIGKKEAWEKYPWNEKYLYGMPEDLEWSFRVRKDNNLTLKFNANSIVKHIIPRYTGDERFSWQDERKTTKALEYLKKTYPEEW